MGSGQEDDEFSMFPHAKYIRTIAVESREPVRNTIRLQYFNSSLSPLTGEVFLSAFSKAVVLDVYSDFINNFSVAMELAKMESKRKSALADFFKVKQISAHDRLSFFGLMVKPVQRFPQFIMFLQVNIFSYYFKDIYMTSCFIPE